MSKQLNDKELDYLRLNKEIAATTAGVSEKTISKYILSGYMPDERYKKLFITETSTGDVLNIGSLTTTENKAFQIAIQNHSSTIAYDVDDENNLELVIVQIHPGKDERISVAKIDLDELKTAQMIAEIAKRMAVKGVKDDTNS